MDEWFDALKIFSGTLASAVSVSVFSPSSLGHFGNDEKVCKSMEKAAGPKNLGVFQGGDPLS